MISFRPPAVLGSVARSLVVLLVAWLPEPVFAGERVIPAGWEPEVLRLIAPLTPGGAVAGGYRIEGIGVADGAFVFSLGGADRAPFRLRIAPAENEPGYELELNPPRSELAPDAVAAAERLRSTLVSRLDKEFWARVTVVVEASSPSPRPDGFPIAPWIAVLVCAVAIILLERSRRDDIAALVGGVAIAILPLVVWYWCWPAALGGAVAETSELWLQDRERDWVQVSLAVALACVALALGKMATSCERMPSAVVDAGLVMLWSVTVRFGWTATNILTDGGSGWSRLLEYRRGFSGVAVLVDLVLPDRSMWDSILVPSLLAACSPSVLVLLANAIGARRTTAALAGLALASLPLHAALYSSDFESGAVVTLALAALALVAYGVRTASALSLAAGLAVAAYALWGRPEAIIVGAPIATLLAFLPADLRRRPMVWAAAAWLLAAAVLRVSSLPTRLESTHGYFAGPWMVLPFGEFLTTSAILPIWLWALAPVGLVSLPFRARLIASVGLLAGLVPVHLTPTMYDPTETYLEFFRYGSFALPWLALLSAAGFTALAALGSRRLRLQWLSGAVVGAAALAMLATPVINLEYLGRRYGPAVDEHVYRQALTRIDPDCDLIVPDDDKALDVLKRYFEITREVHAERGDTTPPQRIVGMSSFLERSGPVDGCRYFYRGVHCQDGFDGQAPPECHELLARYDAEPVWDRVVEYRSHRLVSRPRREASPWYEPRLKLTLYRLDEKLRAHPQAEFHHGDAENAGKDGRKSSL